MKSVFETYPISESEYSLLNGHFGRLACEAGWQLFRKNTNNNHNQDPEDFFQELRLAMVTAAVYYKRQVYVEGCFRVAEEYAPPAYLEVIKDLRHLWETRKKHGANRVLFGSEQEASLEEIVRMFVPPDLQPDKDRPIEVDSTFATYCKTAIWNRQKKEGGKITREKSIRSGLVSFSHNPNLTMLTTAHPKVPRKPRKKN